MEKQVLLQNEYIDKTKNSTLLVRATGSVSNNAHFKNKHDLFYENHEAVVIVDLNQKLVSIQSGHCSHIKQALQSNSLIGFLNHCHSEDKTLVEDITKKYLSYCLENVQAPENTSLNFTCRIVKDTGESIKLLCQIQVFEVHEKHITKLLINITNINFISTQSHVLWSLQADPEQRLHFKKLVVKEYEKLFTPREIDIIKQMKNGFNNVEIGKILFISHQTVATHRKRILKKSKCHSANELMSFCKQRGII